MCLFECLSVCVCVCLHVLERERDYMFASYSTLVYGMFVHHVKSSALGEEGDITIGVSPNYFEKVFF